MSYKVMHLLNHLKIGGAETLVTEYALHIDKNNFESIYVTLASRNETANERKLIQAGMKIIFLGDEDVFPNASNKFKRMINKIHRHLVFHKIVKREKPNIIHTHLNTNSYVISINSKRNKIKLFHTVHSEVKSAFKRMTQRLSTKYCINRKGMVPITLHTKMQEDVNDLFRIKNSLVLPNAINLSRFSNPNKKRRETMNSLGITTDNLFVIGHVGRFVESKNHKLLIDIFAKVKSKRKNAYLLLIGVGQMEEEIMEKIIKLGLQNNVSFLGNREDIPDLMSAMDVFVFPSIHEGFGNVLIEAQAAGIRCVASDRIPKEAFVTNLITSVPLENSVENWAEIVANDNYPKKVEGNLSKHDIRRVIKELENIYLYAGE